MLCVFCILLVFYFTSSCTSVLQNSRTDTPGNNTVHREQYSNKSKIEYESNRVETTAKDIAKTNRNIKTTTTDIEQLLQQQQQYLDGAKQNLATAIRITEKETKSK